MKDLVKSAARVAAIGLVYGASIYIGWRAAHPIARKIEEKIAKKIDNDEETGD